MVRYDIRICLKKHQYCEWWWVMVAYSSTNLTLTWWVIESFFSTIFASSLCGHIYHNNYFYLRVSTTSICHQFDFFIWLTCLYNFFVFIILNDIKMSSCFCCFKYTYINKNVSFFWKFLERISHLIVSSF